MELGEVGGPALGEVAVRLGGGADGNGGQFHEVGVGGLLTTQHHHGHAGAEHRVKALVPRAAGAENPHHHQVGAVEQPGQILVRIDARRIAERVGRP